MAVAVYQTPHCNTCVDDEIKPVFGTAISSSETFCPSFCSSSVLPAIPTRMHPDGIPWQIGLYFLQILSPSGSPSPIDTHLNPVFQRLAMLEDLVIYVTTPLTNTVNPDTNDIIREGGGTVVGFAPQDGDVFLVNLENNTPYMFRVTSVEQVTATSDQLFRITYKAFNAMTDYSAIYDDLSHKVADFDRYKFDINSWLAGKLAFLSALQVAAANERAEILAELLNDWTKFYDPDSATYVAKTLQGRIYDPNVVEIMGRLIPLDRGGQCRHLQISLWNREIPSYYTSCSRSPYTHSTHLDEFQLYQRNQLRTGFSNSHISHTTVEWMVKSPKDVRLTVGSPFTAIPELTALATGYLTSVNYGTSSTDKTLLDIYIENLHAGTVTLALLKQVADYSLTLPVANRYWIIPLLTLSLKG